MEVQHYSLNYVIDLSKLHFRGTPEGLHHGVLDFMITSFDDDGKMLTSGVFKSNSDLTPERYAQLLNSGIRMHLEADIPTKASFMRLGVADVLSNRIGTVEFQLPVKVLQASKAYLGQALPEIEPD